MRTSLKIISILKSFSYTSTDNSFTPSSFRNDLTNLMARLYTNEADEKKQQWDLSSAGRASALQAEGHRFEPYRSHSVTKTDTGKR